MLFTELRFLGFFLIVFAIYWGLRWNGPRKFWLLAASYAFYAGWDWRFLGLIALSTLVDFVVGLALGRVEGMGSRRLLLTASVVVNLGVLGLFKYFDFFAASATQFLGWLGLPLSPRVLDLILPVGISFYTFQTLSYTIDVYRRRLAPTSSLLDFSLFVAFFPQLVAGPIVRASTFLPQLERARRFGEVPVRFCLTLFLVGFIKKACIADNMALLVDPVFADPAAGSAGTLWLAIVLYGVQIFCDFSGYSDMAIATGGLLGFRLPLNFDHPYTASTLTEFWRRWHISLSTWFRDYLYVPLGGSRGNSGGRVRVLLNLATVFFLCGLWHGASWNFVIWGLLHGAVLVVERSFGWREASSFWPLRVAITQLVVMLGWVVFRSRDLSGSIVYYRTLAGLSEPVDGAAVMALAPWWWVFIAALAWLHFALRRRELTERTAFLPDWAYALAFGAAVALALPWVAANYQPFIYFQF